MSDFRFRPIRGTDEQIQNIPHTEGAVYFTTDTKKIYCDFDGERKPMGGNSGIFYGTLKHNITDPSVIDFEFTMDDIEGDQIPNVSDLILNSDGCFYKVVDNKSENIDGVLVITTVKLTIAGSGGGGGGTTPGGPEPTISMEVIKGVKGPYIFGQSANIIYKTTAKD